MKIRFAISLALILVFTGVDAFGAVCETSCKCAKAMGDHHHHGQHFDAADLADASPMPPGMDMSSMSGQRQEGTQVSQLSSAVGACAYPCSPSQCLLNHPSSNDPLTLYQYRHPISALPAPAVACCSGVNCDPPDRAAPDMQGPIHRMPIILRI